MFITEIYFNGVPLDLYPDKNLKYNIQANDIAEVKDRQATYTNSYSLPKTAHNVRQLGGLGIASDTSPYPYQKPDIMVKIDGFPIIVKGWLNVKSTDDEYKIYIYAGIVDFFKTIENKTLGADLDLSEINHDKNLSTVIASFTNPNYRYLITDYNGLTHFGNNGDTINIDYLVPSVNVRYLWDKVHVASGFTYSGLIFDSSKFNNLWITYPKPVPVDNTEFVKEAIGWQNITTVNTDPSNINNFYRQLISGDLVDNTKFIAPATGYFKIVFDADIAVTYNFSHNLQYFISINQEGVPFSERSNSVMMGNFPHISQHVNTETIVFLNQGDVVSFYDFRFMSNGVVNWSTDFNIKIHKFLGGSVSFTDELKAFKITDFITDILNVFGLTPFTDEHSKNIDYLLMAERLVTADVEDWTDKFIKRTNESYVFNSYAQQNIFAYQYNDKEADHNNGAIGINNLNLKESTTVYKSKMYSPEKFPTQFYFGSIGFKTMLIYKIYDKDIKDKNGVQEINYKGLDKRFHYAKSNVLSTTVKIGSKSLGLVQTVNSVPYADFSGLSWRELIYSFYQPYGKILNDSRLHSINLYLYPADVLSLDLRKLYYFAQEGQYYILNKINYDGDDSTKAEFIRVKREFDGAIIPIDPIDPADYTVAVVWGDDNTNTDRLGVAPSQIVKIAGVAYPADDPLTVFEWQVDTGSGFIGLGTGSSPHNVALILGANAIRLKAISQNGYTMFSNVLKYTKIHINCKKYECSKFLNSGEDLTTYYVDCFNQPKVMQEYGSGAWQHSYQICAKEGEISSNGTINDLGNC